MKSFVFVYGALRRGASHAWRMEQAQWLGTAKVKGTLLKIAWYPGLVLEGEGQVLGEVYEVGERTLQALDEFEGVTAGEHYNQEYERVEAEVMLDDGRTMICQIYQWQLGTAGYEVIVNGDWLTVPVSRGEGG